jgi:DNA-binding NtrC family response regulator
LQNCIEELGDDLFFVCGSEATRQLRCQAELLAKASVPVLIIGETGTGKGTVGRLIHKLSACARVPICAIDCTESSWRDLDRALGETNPPIEGQIAQAPPLMKECHTILLRNILGLAEDMQTKILNHFAEASGRGINSELQQTQPRIIATSHPYIATSVAAGTFSAELYSYLSPFTISVPPLRNRKEEIPFLLSHFMNQVACKYDLPPRMPSGAAQFACQSYSWPENVKELQDFVKRYLIMGDTAITFTHVKCLPLEIC